MSRNKKNGFIAICIIMLFALGGCGTNVGDEPVQMEERDIPTLDEVEGIGEVRAKNIKQSLKRIDIPDWCPILEV